MAEQPDKQQKTEEATPQRLREAREKGQVALSTEAVSAMSLIAVAGSLLILGGFLAQAVGAMVATSIEGVGSKGLLTLESDSAAALITDSIRGVSSEFFLVILPALAVAALVGYGQAGLQFAPKAVSMDPSKLNPAKGVTRLFSARSRLRWGRIVSMGHNQGRPLLHLCISDRNKEMLIACPGFIPHVLSSLMLDPDHARQNTPQAIKNQVQLV